jgi:probable rRNA maturation factor
VNCVIHVNAPGVPRDTRTLLKRAARLTLSREEAGAGQLSVTLLDDGEIQALNRDYLGHDRVTDVISFALHGPGDPILGDVYLGGAQAARQAEEEGVPLQEELVRLVVHGTLHVLGHDHPQGEERLDSPMFLLQEELVRQVLWAGASGTARGTLPPGEGRP